MQRLSAFVTILLRRGQLILAPVVILSYFCIGIPSAWLSPLPGGPGICFAPYMGMAGFKFISHGDPLNVLLVDFDAGGSLFSFWFISCSCYRLYPGEWTDRHVLLPLVRIWSRSCRWPQRSILTIPSLRHWIFREKTTNSHVIWCQQKIWWNRKITYWQSDETSENSQKKNSQQDSCLTSDKKTFQGYSKLFQKFIWWHHLKLTAKLGGGFKYFLIFTPIPGELESNLTSIFFKGVGSTTN